MVTPKTRQQMIDEANGRIFSAINALMAALAPQDYEYVANGIMVAELEHKGTTSDDWYELADELTGTIPKTQAFRVAQAVLVRNGYRDGLPFCPLCGKIGIANNNGAPVIDAPVCNACNQRKVIPARIREAFTNEHKELGLE